jgi:hypothetical protein
MTPSHLHRRSLLQAGGAGLLGLTLPQLLKAAERPKIAPGKAKAVILLFMWGGPAHQDTWDLKPDAPAEIRGQFKPISTNVPGIQISEHFPLLAKQCDKLAIVRSMTHGNVDHTPSTHFLLTGQPPPANGDVRGGWPNMGAVLSKLGLGRGPLPPFVSMRPKLPNDVPRFVEESQGQFAAWLGPQHNPLIIDADPNSKEYSVEAFQLHADITVNRLADRKQLLTELNHEQARLAEAPALAAVGSHYQRAYDLLQSAVAGSAFNLAEEPDAMRDRYGRNPHGQSVLLARRLVERGVPLVTCFWPSEGIKNVSVYWDTHSRNFVDLKERLMPPTDRAFSTLLDDLKERGLLDETLVVWTGEFGRTPRVGQRNSDAGAGADGRDHWPNCFTSVLAGGGIRGGQVYGASDRHAAYPSLNPTAPVDLIATIYHLLGLPERMELQDQQGRPLVVCPGEVIRELLA